MRAIKPDRRTGQVPDRGLPSNPFFASREQRLSLARERFFDEGEMPTGLVPDVVLQSWHRCLRARRQPQERLVLEPVTKTRIATVLSQNRLLLDVARADLAELDAAVSGTSACAILLGRTGVIAHSTPFDAARGALLATISRVGVDLGEHHIGTGAPNVATHMASSCTVLGSEHFFSEMKSLYCAAAPIHDASGRIAAVLNLSSEGEMFRFDAGSMVRLCASAIESRLLVAQSRDRVLARFHTSPHLLHTPLAGLACISDEGDLAWLNEAGAGLLGIARVPAGGTPAERVFGVRLEKALAGQRQATPSRITVPSGLAIWVEVAVPSAGESAPESESESESGVLMPRTATGSDIDHGMTGDRRDEARGRSPGPKLYDINRAVIEDQLAAHHGNVSRAARDLGVSRGLLYRRIRDWGSSR